MEDTIIFALIERAQFLHIDPIYASDAQRPFANQNAPPPPLCSTERIPAFVRLYTSPDENALALTGAPLSHALHPTCTNKTNALYSRPTTYVLPAPRADPTYIIAYSTG